MSATLDIQIEDSVFQAHHQNHLLEILWKYKPLSHRLSFSRSAVEPRNACFRKVFIRLVRETLYEKISEALSSSDIRIENLKCNIVKMSSGQSCQTGPALALPPPHLWSVKLHFPHLHKGQTSVLPSSQGFYKPPVRCDDHYIIKCEVL